MTLLSSSGDRDYWTIAIISSAMICNIFLLESIRHVTFAHISFLFNIKLSVIWWSRGSLFVLKKLYLIQNGWDLNLTSDRSNKQKRLFFQKKKFLRLTLYCFLILFEEAKTEKRLGLNLDQKLTFHNHVNENLTLQYHVNEKKRPWKEVGVFC